ncbi:MAG TPA: alpha/beta hydrolase [Acidimicrobiales bacterium]|nr:alpha/beta hydrolase [Acidimicrobiales bacterium]
MAGPLEMLDALARQEVALAPGLRHVEVYTMRGLLTVLWHGDADAPAVVVLCGGAMGGLLGPADGFYQWLGEELAAPGSGIGVLRVSWRRPNDIPVCTLDLLAVADLAARTGAVAFVTGGHSFGGAIAVRAAMALGDWARGVVTFASQSAGCEEAAGLTAPLLAFHGDRDEILPLFSSQAVCELAGGETELVVCEGTGHLLTEAGDLLRERVPAWIRERLADPYRSATG